MMDDDKNKITGIDRVTEKQEMKQKFSQMEKKNEDESREMKGDFNRDFLKDVKDEKEPSEADVLQDEIRKEKSRDGIIVENTGSVLPEKDNEEIPREEAREETRKSIDSIVGEYELKDQNHKNDYHKMIHSEKDAEKTSSEVTSENDGPSWGIIDGKTKSSGPADEILEKIEEKLDEKLPRNGETERVTEKPVIQDEKIKEFEKKVNETDVPVFYKKGEENEMKDNENKNVEKYDEDLKNLKKNYDVTDDLHNFNEKVNQNFEKEDREKVKDVKDVGPFLGNEMKDEGKKLTKEEDDKMNLTDFTGREYVKDVEERGKEMADEETKGHPTKSTSHTEGNPSDKIKDNSDSKNLSDFSGDEYIKDIEKQGEKLESGLTTDDRGATYRNYNKQMEKEVLEDPDRIGRKTDDADNADYMINPEGKVEDLDPEKARNSANEMVQPGENAPVVDGVIVKNRKKEEEEDEKKN